MPTIIILADSQITVPDHVSSSHHQFPGHVGIHLMFPNGYGASVVQGRGTYGGSEGLFEIGVLGQDELLTYTTPITDDVIGWCDVAKVESILFDIASLPSL